MSSCPSLDHQLSAPFITYSFSQGSHNDNASGVIQMRQVTKGSVNKNQSEAQNSNI